MYRPVRAHTGMSGDIHTRLLRLVGDLAEDVRERTEVPTGDGTDGVKNVFVVVQGRTLAAATARGLTAALLAPRLGISVLD